MLEKLCIIPARGGSKRIPRKNIRDFLGKPVIAYSIETALASNLFDEVMVSTDDDEIAKIGKSYGAEIPFMRSKNTSNDFATLADVVEEVKTAYQNNGKSFQSICCILPTAPFVSIELIQKGYSLLKKTKVDSVKPVVRFSYPIQRAVMMDTQGMLQMFHPEHLTTRSQDLKPAFHDAGQLYWMKSEVGLKGPSKLGFEISERFVQDIDTEEDWHLAELKYKYQFDKKNTF